jgi:integrase
MASTKRSNGEGSLYYDKSRDRWVAVRVVGFRDGKPIRRKVSAKSRANAAAKLRELDDKIQAGTIPSGRIPTVREWMTYWLNEVAAERNRPSTVKAYRTYVDRYIIPLLGDHRLDRLSPEHLSAAWRSLMTDGCPGKDDARPLSSTSAHQAHVILSRALKVAQQRGHVAKNVATLTDAPPVQNADMEVLTRDQARRVVEAAHGHRNAARWTVAFTLGLRQGEALGLRWRDVDLARGTLKVEHSLGRVTGEGLRLGPVKSKTGRRTIAIPKPLLAELKAHRQAQAAERLAAGSMWHDGDFVFATVFGKPIDPKSDWEAWRALLVEAEAPMVRLHAARHTAITMMLALEIPAHVVKEIAGHAKFSTTEVYVDKVDELHLDAAERMGAFWG